VNTVVVEKGGLKLTFKQLKLNNDDIIINYLLPQREVFDDALLASPASLGWLPPIACIQLLSSRHLQHLQDRPLKR
jgi:hypothetical protein